MTLDDLKQPQPIKKSKAHVFSVAEQFARDQGFLPGDSIEPLVERLGGYVKYLGVHDSFFEHDGSLRVWGPGEFEIRISGLTGAERDRFTIAHELGHYVLHSKCGEEKIQADRNGSTPVEWEANWFAAALLMPADDFKATCEWNYNDPVAVAARYMVSAKAAEIRMESLGIEPRRRGA